MGIATAAAALVLYPILFNLPLNLVRFEWGFRRGLAPMPHDIEQRAIAADIFVQIFDYLLLATVVVLLVRRSYIPVAELGFSESNWIAASTLGVLVGIVLLGFLSVLLRNSPDEMRKEPESHGSFLTWCGIQALGSFSVEFWRAFCIVALVRLDLSATLAILITAAASGASQVTMGMARAAGEAAFGCLAGMLFVGTGALWAPVALSFVTGTIYAGYVRRTARLPSTKASRSSLECPVCSTVFEWRQRHKGFACPHCGTKLMYQEGGLDWVCVEFSMFFPPVTLYLAGLRDWRLVLASTVGIVLTFFSTIAIYNLLNPPELVQKSAELRLTAWRTDPGNPGAEAARRSEGDK